MKSGIVSSFLLVVLTAYLIIPVFPVIDYLLNKDYIAKNLCVNKDKPKSCCKGKCHMVKQLQKANPNSENNSRDTNKRIQFKDLNEFVISNSFRFNPEIPAISYQYFYITAYKDLAKHTVFVPPKPVFGS